MVLDRLRRAAARRQTPPLTLERHPDDLPKIGLFTEPVRVASLRALDPEQLDDGRHRVTFLLEVRDAEDKRCSQFFVEARVSGPERSRVVSGATDLLGRVRFRMAGPPGDYHLEVTNVAAGGLEWDRAGGPVSADAAIDA